MLPHINTENRDIGSSHRVLVLGRSNLQSTLRTSAANQPSPSTTLDTQQRGPERILESLLATPLRNNRLLEGGCRSSEIIARCTRGSEVLPEEGVVDVTAAVEADLLLQGDQSGDIVALGGGRVGSEGCVKVVDVGLVVL